jgi:hypothetical protein
MLPNDHGSSGNNKRGRRKNAREPIPADALTCRVHLIWMSDCPPVPVQAGPTRPAPLVRILLVSIGGDRAVYEAWGPLSIFRDWIDRFLVGGNRKRRLDIARWIIRSGGLVTIKELRIPLRELAAQGFSRVDRLDGGN